MNADLLNALREKDPELWDLWNESVKHFRWMPGSSHSNAWLQHCIQDAIRARGWDFKIEKYHNSIWGMIRIPYECWVDEIFKRKADSEVEALLRAYLAAIGGSNETCTEFN